MRLEVTLDMIDGSKSKSVTAYADEVDMRFILTKLSAHGVGGITITRKDVLKKYLKEETTNDQYPDTHHHGR